MFTAIQLIVTCRVPRSRALGVAARSTGSRSRSLSPVGTEDDCERPAACHIGEHSATEPGKEKSHQTSNALDRGKRRGRAFQCYNTLLNLLFKPIFYLKCNVNTI